ncbi:MAG: tyrosine-type recombinase/integrase [Clostridiales bacterium]|nr:tyrosine-type recombinase/integrase [Clostridiales bacterium]
MEATVVIHDPFTAHWLRHTFVTMMYLAGIDVLTAKEQAGYVDIQTIMAIYTHLDGAFKQKQIDKLDKYINNPSNIVAN